MILALRKMLGVMLLLSATALFAQPDFGPYSDDANTVLLMHFDGDLSDASSVGNTAQSVGSVTFSADNARFGSAAYLDNSGTFPTYTGDDSAYYADGVPTFPNGSFIQVLPNGALDLDGDWTIEFWFKPVDAQPANATSGWSKNADIVSKKNPDGAYNYFVRYRSRNWYTEGHRFTFGYTEDNSGHVHWDGETAVGNFTMEAPGPPLDVASFTDGQNAPVEDRYDWYHITYQRDGTNHWHAMATHDASGNLVHYKGEKLPVGMDKRDEYRRWQYSPGVGKVSTGSGSDTLIIGGGNGSWPHGYIDELRISDVVRPLTGVPPLAAPLSDTYTPSHRGYSFLGFPEEVQRAAGDDLERPPSLNGPEGGVWRWEWANWDLQWSFGFDRIPNQYDDQAGYEIRLESLIPGRPGAVTDATINYNARTQPLTDRLPKETTAWQQVSMTLDADGKTWRGTIPQQPSKSVVEYWITTRAENDDGLGVELGTYHDMFHTAYLAPRFDPGGFTQARGQKDTYYRFMVVPRNAKLIHLTFDGDDPIEDISEFADVNVGQIDGSVTFPDDVPEGDYAPADNFASARFDGLNVPGFIEFIDADHFNARSYTVTHWAKIDTFMGGNHFVVHHNGSRWAHQQPGYTEQGRWQNKWWVNHATTAAVRPGDQNTIEHYTHAAGEWPNDFEGATINNPNNHWARNANGIEWLEKGKWYKIINAARWNDVPDLTHSPEQLHMSYGGPTGGQLPDASREEDFYVQQIIDEDGTRWWYRMLPMRVPGTDMEGPFRIGHRGDDESQPFFTGNVDELIFYNYFRGPDEDPDLWAFAADNNAGAIPTVGIVDDIADGTIPLTFALDQNYPNPFNPTTTIDFAVPKLQDIELAIYDILGRRVKTLVSRQLTPGTYSVVWDGTNLSGTRAASGMYFYRLDGENKSITKKMLLLQ